MHNAVQHILPLCRQSTPSWPRSVSSLFYTGCVCLFLICVLISDLECLPACAAEPGTPVATTEQTSKDSNRRYILKGKTAVTEFKLNELESYRTGMVALEKRNFSGAEILFKKAAAQLGEGYEKYRAECLFFQAKCLVMMERKGEATNLYKSAAKLFELHDSQNAYKAIANAQILELTGGKAKADKQKLQSEVKTQNARLSIDQNITLAARVTNSDTNKFLLHVDKEAIPKTVYNCFAEMTCLETAEIGSNYNNAVGRWQPLLVEDNPAALNLGTSNPVISVKMNGVRYKINLPTFRGLKRILLATDNEKICAMDLDTYDTWLLRMKKNRDGSLQSCSWAKLTHVKSRGDSAVGSAPSWENRAKVPTGWDNKASGTHGWENSAKGNTGWGGRAGGNTGWGSRSEGTTGWGISGKGQNSILPPSAETPRHFSRERRRGTTRGSSGF